MLRTVAGLMFAAILSPLGLRLVLPFVELPEVVQPFEDLLVWWTDLLAAPFAALDAGSMVGDFLPGAGRGGGLGGFGALDPDILAALIGWTVVQGVVMTVLALIQRR